MQLQFKIRKIKVQLATHLEASGHELTKQSTIKNFIDLRSKAIKSRLQGLYSYNVLDNPQYIRSKKVE